MPELPEVETIRRNLNGSSLIGRAVTGVELLWPRTLAEPAPEMFAERITGQAFREVGRRGKFLIFHLSKDFFLIHLRMSGDLFLETTDSPLPAFPRLILSLTGGMRLVFTDMRKFGRAWLVSDPHAVLRNLGPEPLDPAFTSQELYTRLRASRRRIKTLLLDQTFLAGIGNIYADEALHLAGLHPLSPAHQLTYSQAERLWSSIRQVLEGGIRRNGTSIDWLYRGGDFQNYLQVYGRTGKPCLSCGSPVVRMVVGQRGTHLCPVCQPVSVEM
jgi:formamidopyrimidine-DNA glycosylase